MSKLSRLIVAAVGILLLSALWWPVSVRGIVVHGDTGEPVPGVSIFSRSHILKPWWPIMAMAWGDLSNPVYQNHITNQVGSFRITVFAGLRLESTHLTLRKKGMVVEPKFDSVGAYVYSNGTDRGAQPTLYAWEDAGELLVGRKVLEDVGNVLAFSVRLGDRDHSSTFTVSATTDANKNVTELSLRPDAGVIRKRPLEVDWLVAPRDGYHRLLQQRIDCLTEPFDAEYFFHNDNGSYGWISFNLLDLCPPNRDKKIDRLSIEFRLGTKSGNPTLVCAEEDRPPGDRSGSCFISI